MAGDSFLFRAISVVIFDGSNLINVAANDLTRTVSSIFRQNFDGGNLINVILAMHRVWCCMFLCVLLCFCVRFACFLRIFMRFCVVLRKFFVRISMEAT